MATYDDAAEAARARAAASLRRFGHALHSRQADVDLLEMIADAADRLSDQLDDAPGRVRDLDALKHQIWVEEVPEGAVIDHFDDCIVSGAWNPFGMGVEMRRDDREVVAEITLGPAFEGAPGRSHGGVVAAIFDDVLGAILRLEGQPAFTGELTVRYLAPTPIGVPLTFRSRMVRLEGRKLDTEAEATTVDPDTGETVLLATATARFITIDAYVS